MGATLLGEIIESLFGSPENSVRAFLAENTDIRSVLARWLAEAGAPISVGDALFQTVLAGLVGVPIPEAAIGQGESCKQPGGAYLPIPGNDFRWGKVRPVSDVYSTVQGTMLDALITNDTRVVVRGRGVINGMVRDYPYSVEASNTELEYRKLSEILLQGHYCAALAALRVDGGPVDRLVEVVSNACRYVIGSPYALQFVTPIFRLSCIAKLPTLRVCALPWKTDDVVRAIERLAVEDGVLEYRVADKVDERAGSRSRSSRDQEYPWTYSTAYGAAVLSIWGGRGTELASKLRAVLERRLSAWPDGEIAVTIKEFRTPFGGGATAYSAVAGLAAQALLLGGTTRG